MTTDAVSTHDVVDDVGSITFSPPLYRQRYDFVASVLREDKVADFGCAECRALLVFRDVHSLQRIVGVDIDRPLLADTASRLMPRVCDYLFRRSNPLSVELYHGSVTDVDQRLCSVEAVSLIELVEHLHEPILSQLPTTVFGRIAPQTVIVTTPNVEFNVLFPTLVGFRHPDHKFEWTRQQFEDWCNGVAETWNYSVEFGGVGKPPDDWSHVGCCSQYAVFRRQQKRNSDAIFSAGLPYEQLLTVEYPVQAEVSTDDGILHEALYYMHFMATNLNTDTDAADSDDTDDGRHSISLHQLLTFSPLQDLCHGDVSILRRVLVDAGLQLTADEEFVVYKMDYDKYDDDVDDDDGACSEESSVQQCCQWDTAVEEDWN